MPARRDFRIRDPFVLPVAEERTYYMFGTTYRVPGREPDAFEYYLSRDLENWDGPHPAFLPPPGLWANIWGAEVHERDGAFYMIGTLKAAGGYRGVHVLRAEAPGGPYVPQSDGPISPAHWECIDGTLHMDAHGDAWVPFCHEWVQTYNGGIYAMRVSDDLSRAVDRPVYLFSATDAPWVLPIKESASAGNDPSVRFPCYVTDGTFLHRTASGELLMLWSSFGATGYIQGVARSDDGTVTGHWEQLSEPLWAADGGHGMLFRTFEGRLTLCLHSPNGGGKERAVFVPVEETDGGLRVAHPKSATQT